MLTVIGIMFLGVIVGLVVRNNPPLFLSKLISYVIFLLLLLLGISVGLNSLIMSNLPTLGLQALIITVGAMAGSVLLSWILFRYLFK